MNVKKQSKLDQVATSAFSVPRPDISIETGGCELPFLSEVIYKQISKFGTSKLLRSPRLLNCFFYETSVNGP